MLFRKMSKFEREKILSTTDKKSIAQELLGILLDDQIPQGESIEFYEGMLSGIFGISMIAISPLASQANTISSCLFVLQKVLEMQNKVISSTN